jgi:DNA polymerase III subunit gamma/tau
MANDVLYTKYRPLVFDDIIGQEHIVRILKNSISKNGLVHAYLFSGIRGTGKTTTARILARYLNCLNPHECNPCNECSNCKAILQGGGSYTDVEEIDAASNRGVEDARKLRERLIYKPQHGHKVIIIDEAHQLTPEASQALLKTFEEPPEKTTFILCTTEPEQLLDTIHSRCQCLNFKPVSSTKIQKHLKYIIDNENWKISDEVLYHMAVLANYSVRDGISQLNKISNCVDDDGNIDDEDALMLLGAVNRENVYLYLNAIIKPKPDIAEVFKIIDKIVEGGGSIQLFLKDVMVLIKDLMCLKACKNMDSISNITEQEKEVMVKLLKNLNSFSLLNSLLSALDDCYGKIIDRKNLPPDVIVIEASMSMVSKVISHNKKKGAK